MRSAVAVLAGLLIFSVAAMVPIMLSGRTPDQRPEPGFAAFSVIYGVVAAAVAGWAAARIAGRAPIAHAVGVAALLIGTAAFSYSIQVAGASLWSLIVTIVASAPAAIAGGYLYRRRGR